MKKLFLSVFIMLISLCAAFAQSESDFTVTMNNAGNGVVITGYTGREKRITIPAEIGGYPVTEIYNSVWDGIEWPNPVFDDSNVVSVEIPKGVTSIGAYAFWGCISLTSVTIPTSVTSIGRSAFRGCESLKSVNIPDSVTSIGDSAFWGCISLTSIALPNSLTSIEYSVFTNCVSLDTVTMTDSVTSIGDYAFLGCTKLTSVVIPDSVQSIGIAAFFNCTRLRSITIPPSVRTIKYQAFSGCSNLQNVSFSSSITTQIDFPVAASDESFFYSTHHLYGTNNAFYNCLNMNLKSQSALKKVGYKDRF